MGTSKLKIYRFDTMIYPGCVWVCVGGKFSDLQKVFDYRPGSELEEDDGWLTKMGAMTIDCHNKKNDFRGVLIWFPKKSDMCAEFIAHEASHAAMYIFQNIGAEVDMKNQEPYAYLVGWIAGATDYTRKGKAKEETYEND